MLQANFNKKIRALAIPALLLMSAHTMAADGPITISSTIPYANDDVGSAAIRTECHWNTELPAALVAQSNGAIVSTDKDLSTVSGKKLVITVANVHASGGIFSGPRWAVLHGELFEDGKLQGNFQLRRVSAGGAPRTACPVLGHIGKALTADILNWLKNPTMSATTTDAAETPPEKQ
jgi:hypothetical protein